MGIKVRHNGQWVEFTPPSSGGGVGVGTTDKISEGNSKAEIIDTATESKFTVEIDAAEKFSVDIGGPKIHRQDNSNEGGSVVFNRAVDDVAAFELDVYGSSSSDSGRFRIVDSTGGVERFAIGPSGQIGLSGANYGTSGQVLTSNGSSSAPTWQTVSGGSGGGGEPVGTIIAWSGTVATIPTGYQLCDGSAASTLALQAITGTNVPDLTNRFIIGADADATINGVVLPTTSVTGSATTTGGSKDATLPSHNHTINYYGADDESGGPIRFAANFDRDEADATPGTITTNNQGSPATNANLPPYYALCYIIKHTATSGSSSSSGGGSLVKLGTVATNTGTEAAFTNIPSTAKKITVSLYRFSYNTTDGTSDDIIMEVGDSSGYANSGYQSTYDSVNIVGNLNAKGSTTFYGLADDTTIGNDYNITIELVNVSGNSWSISHQGGDSDDKVLHGGGSITLSNALDRLRIKTENGRTLDNGEVTVYYETEGGGSSSSGGSEGTDAGQGFFVNDTTLNSSKTLPANKNVGIFGPYTIGNNVTLTVPTGTTFTVV